MTTWDDRQYLKFLDERTRAAQELLARVPLGDAGSIVDLGCGPGNSTALLRARFPGAEIVGVDSSPEMLERARREHPSIEWVLGDARRYRPQEPVDLVFANALLQWLPDHGSLLPALLDCVRPGGALAVQMPCNFEEPSHRLMREVPGPWAKRIEHVRATNPVASPAFYYDVLVAGATLVDIWHTTYQHVMPDAAAIVEWVKGTGLRPFLEALTEAEQTVYLAAYERAIDDAYPPQVDGKRLFSFPRLFFIAVR